jgi:CBS domain containing-hemolysin-like protein
MEPPSSLIGIFLGLSSIVLLILANAYFVATEFALVAVRRSQAKLWMEQGRPGARATAHAIEHLDDAIAATQLGITLASIGLGFIGEPALARVIDPVLRAAGIDSLLGAHGAAIAVTFTLITFFHVVVGELAPKALALDRPREVALACARPLLIFARIFRWVLWVMNGAGNLLVRAFGVQPAGHLARVHSAEELLIVVGESREAGKLKPQAARMLGNVLRFTGKRVRELMVPREQVQAVPLTMKREDLLRRVSAVGYTRYPVYDGELDRIVGVLHTKDLFAHDDSDDWSLERIVRTHLEMSAGLSVSNALRRFRREHSHLAIVREHVGGPVIGILALEDVLEEIVGEIEDEHDKVEEGVFAVGA